MKVLSIRQPWAWLIVNGHKNIENRTWWTNFRGEVLIHASKGMTRNEYDDVDDFLDDSCDKIGDIFLPEFKAIERGGIVGIAEITDCVKDSDSPWFVGPYGFVLRNAKPLPFHPLRGMLGFFDAPEDAKVNGDHHG